MKRIMQFLKRLFSGEEPEEQLQGQKMNTIKMLRLWKEGENGNHTWRFDDPTCGLVAEPFVGSANRVIDAIIEHNGAKLDKEHMISLFFSHVEFPGSTKLILVEEKETVPWVGTGVTYRLDGTDMEAWLCPAFYHYFDADQVPQKLYAIAV